MNVLRLLEEIPWRLIANLPPSTRLRVLNAWSPASYIRRNIGHEPKRVERVVDHLVHGAQKSAAHDPWDAQTYRLWVAVHDRLDEPRLADLARLNAGLANRPLFSLILDATGNPADLLSHTLESLRAQLYPEWELCLIGRADGTAKSDPRIRVLAPPDASTPSARADAALHEARGSWIGRLQAGDRLSPDALLRMADEAARFPAAAMMFSDEDRLDAQGRRCDPVFKPDWNPALMLSQNAFGGLGLMERQLAIRAGGYRSGFEGAEDHDLALRGAALISVRQIRHIPRILFHARTRPDKAQAWDAGARAIESALRSNRIDGRVTRRLEKSYGVEYAAPAEWPLLSLVIASTLGSEIQATCLNSILAKTTYPNLEIVLAISAGHRDRIDRDEFSRLRDDPRLRLCVYDHTPFNYSWVNNRAAEMARGDYLCLLNDDIEIETLDWAEKLVARAMLPGVGAVGAMLYFPDGTIQHAGVILGIGGVAAHVGHREKRGWSGYCGRGGLEQDLSCVTAACIVLPRHAFLSAGALDETYPVSFNDVDLCLKLRRLNYRIIWTPDVQLIHHESASWGPHMEGDMATRFHADFQLMRENWQESLDADPFYNLSLSLRFGRIYRYALPRGLWA